MHFASQFNILPSLLTSEQTNLIFRTLAHNKSSEKSTGQAGLTYDEFCQGLFRIAIKNQYLLNGIFAKSQENLDDPNIQGFKEKSSESYQKNFKNMINESKRVVDENTLNPEKGQNTKGNANFDLNIDDKNKEDDEYNKNNEMTVETLEGLIIFLDIPNDLKSLNEKLRSLRIENAKIIPPRDKKIAGKRALEETFNSPNKNKRDTSFSPSNIKHRATTNNIQSYSPVPSKNDKKPAISKDQNQEQKPEKNQQLQSNSQSPPPKNEQSAQSLINQKQSPEKAQPQGI